MVGAAGAGDMPGVAGAPPSGCPNPQQQVLVVTADTWIEAAKPNNGHGSDHTLSVVGGGQERRALFQLTLPAVTAGTVLLKATLSLHLQGNADTRLVRRDLQVHRLGQEITEAHTTWTSYGQGSRNWILPGGDFGPMLAQAAIPAGTSQGPLAFDLTATLQATVSGQAIPLSLIILESSLPPPAPADLAFASREGDASGIPALILEYCPP